MKPYNPTLKSYSRNLRCNLTDAEQLLWSKLRRKQILGLQFYRQKPVSGFIVDFYCAAANLVIELDGSQHVEPEHQIKDIQRDQKLKTLGLQVLRFNNHQVLTELDAVMDMVFEVVKKKIPPNPPFTKGGIKAVTAETDALPVTEDTQNSPIFAEKKRDTPIFEKIVTNIPSFEEVAPNSIPFEEVAPNSPSSEETPNTPPFDKGGQGGFSKKGNSQ